MGEMTILQPGEIEIYDIVEEINREHELCIGSMRNTLEHAIRVGELLNEQKEKGATRRVVYMGENELFFCRKASTILYAYCEICE